MEIEKAIVVLKEKYEEAMEKEYIRDPVAWALYQTWKEAERERWETDKRRKR